MESCCLAESPNFIKCNATWSDPVSMIIGYDLNLAMLENTYARITHIPKSMPIAGAVNMWVPLVIGSYVYWSIKCDHVITNQFYLVLLDSCVCPILHVHIIHCQLSPSLLWSIFTYYTFEHAMIKKVTYYAQYYAHNHTNYGYSLYTILLF